MFAKPVKEGNKLWKKLILRNVPVMDSKDAIMMPVDNWQTAGRIFISGGSRKIFRY